MKGFYFLCKEESSSPWSHGQVGVLRDLMKMENLWELEGSPGSTEPEKRLATGLQGATGLGMAEEGMPSCLSRGSVMSLWQKDNKARKWGNWQGDRCTRNRRWTWKEVKRQLGCPCVWKVLWCQTRCQAVVSEIFGISISNVGKFRVTLPWEWISKVAWRWRLIKIGWSRNWEAGNIHRDINSPREECVVWVGQAVSHMRIFKEMGRVGGCRRDVDL